MSTTYQCSLSQIREPSGGKARSIPAWLLARLAEEKERRFCPQAYRSIYEFAEKHHLVLGKKGPPWRLTDRLVGYINGLPGSFGHLTATNGILCYVENNVGLFKGHMHWFEKVELEEQADGADGTAKISDGTKAASRRKYSAGEVDMLLE